MSNERFYYFEKGIEKEAIGTNSVAECIEENKTSNCLFK